ncbi:MAG: FtsX-like permease family protein [Candidatus Bathyarchaeia archaeon]
MSETFFPINDLMRRKLQTTLTIISLTLSVASTLFLLLSSDKIGFGISLMVEGKLTAGFSTVLSQFIIFVAFLIFTAGAVFISFMVFVMMSQRIKDVGLMKAVGCPNDLIFGYFMNELLIVTFIGCFLGVVLGLLADFAITNILNSLGFQISQKPIDFWLVLIVFIISFVLALIFGAKPILDTTKVEPAKAFSPTYYLGVTAESKFKAVSKRGLTVKIALRSLFRRKSATIRILLCLAIVFLLVTVAIAGGIIAHQTTKNWVEKAVGKDIILIAHKDICDRYTLLLSKFYETKETSVFNYTEARYMMPEEILDSLGLIADISIEKRLITHAHVKEVPGYVFNSETGATTSVGKNREGESLVVGVEPEKTFGRWFMEGEFFAEGQSLKAVVGDSIANKMFTMPLNQSLQVYEHYFDVVGICIDPINNGNIIYVPLRDLQNITGLSKPNVVMVKAKPSVNRTAVLDEIKAKINATNSEFAVLELNEILERSTAFLGYIWSTIMFLPIFSLASASLCFVGYVMLAITEQHQEFGVLRALGAKPRTILKIVAVQNFVVLLSSYACGVAFGTIITLLILIPKPLVTSVTIIQIATWLLTALTATFIPSLYPAIKFAKKPITEILA